MKVSLSWIQDYLDIHDKSTHEIADILTMTGLEVEGIEVFEEVPGGLKGLVVGEVKETKKHPNADKLTITLVDTGDTELHQIICGAPNVAAGQKVVVAPVNTTIYPLSNEPFTIKKAKIRGEKSEGMICAEDEIGLGPNHDGIMVLGEYAKVGEPVANLFSIKEDQILEIGLTPNRTDAISHLGVCRDLRAILKRPIVKPDISDFNVDCRNHSIKVTVEDFEACPRYAGVSISGITIAPSPKWLQQKLKSIGLSPINNVVDITNFVLHETGQPLHAFDLAMIKGGKIVIKTLKDNTPFTSLDEKERKLSEHDLMICDEQEGMCIAGVFGGNKSGVTNQTTSIFLESAVFSQDYIRKTAARHGLKTDASFRFERGVDPNGVLYALKRAALLIREIAGGEISSEIIDLKKAQFNPHQITLSISYIHTIIGVEIDKTRIQEILELLDFEILKKDKNSWLIAVPTYRTDVLQPADVAEEILRIYGYNNIDLSENLGSSYLSFSNAQDTHPLRISTGKTLAGYGFFEIFTNSLTRKRYVEAFWKDKNHQPVSISNSSSEDLMYLKPTVLWTGLEVIRHNQNYKQTGTRFFEFAKTYYRNIAYEEKEWLSLYVAGKTEDSWVAREKNYAYHDLFEAIQLLVYEKFGLEMTIKSLGQSTDFQYGIELFAKNNISLGVGGKVAPDIVKNFGIEGEVFHARLNWQYISGIYNDKKTFEPIVRFPEVKRDLSLVIDEQISYQSISMLARQTAGKLLRTLQVFDVYKGEKIEKNKKAVAITFTLQDKEKTLTDKVIDKTMNRVMESFERELNAIIRK